MAEITTKKIDALGFDKWQIADIKRAYRSNAMSYNKMKRLKDKIDALIDEYNSIEAQTLAWEGPVKVISNNVLGMELTSIEILRFHEHPEEFYAAHPEHPLTIAQGNSNPTPDVPVEENIPEGTGELVREEPSQPEESF